MVEKQALVERVWRGVAVTDNALTRAVKELRSAIGDDANAPRYVETVARRGYRFVGRVRAGGALPRAMLAVLPFADLSRDPEDYFCDGLTEELITQIAHLNAERLGVIARTSAMAYKASPKSIAEVGQELGVGYVLEGSVRREGERVRISAQLIEVRDQTHVWAESYEELLGDVLKAQRRVAESVARAVRVELGPMVGSRPAPRSLDPEAYAACLKGRYLWNRRTGDAIRQAIDAFELAIRREPTYASSGSSSASLPEARGTGEGTPKGRRSSSGPRNARLEAAAGHAPSRRGGHLGDEHGEARGGQGTVREAASLQGQDGLRGDGGDRMQDPHDPGGADGRLPAGQLPHVWELSGR